MAGGPLTMPTPAPKPGLDPSVQRWLLLLAASCIAAIAFLGWSVSQHFQTADAEAVVEASEPVPAEVFDSPPMVITSVRQAAREAEAPAAPPAEEAPPPVRVAARTTTALPAEVVREHYEYLRRQSGENRLSPAAIAEMEKEGRLAW